MVQRMPIHPLLGLTDLNMLPHLLDHSVCVNSVRLCIYMLFVFRTICE